MSSDRPLPSDPTPWAPLPLAAETQADFATNETSTRGRCFSTEAGSCLTPQPRARPCSIQYLHGMSKTQFAHFAENTVATESTVTRALSTAAGNCHYVNELAQDPTPHPTPHRAPQPALSGHKQSEALDKRPRFSFCSLPAPSFPVAAAAHRTTQPASPGEGSATLYCLVTPDPSKGQTRKTPGHWIKLTTPPTGPCLLFHLCQRPGQQENT